MNEFEPQQTPQEAQTAETQAVETPAAEAPPTEAAAAEPALPEPPREPELEPAAALEPPAEPEAPAQPPAPAARPAAPRSAQEPRNARAAQRAAQAERGKGQGGAKTNDRARTQGPAREGARAERGRGPEGPIEIDLEKLIADSLYLDNQAHAIVARMRDMDSGTRSQLRRLFSAVRRACRTQEPERQHAFVMLRARLAYTIARHQLRSLDPLEKLLLQVTRKNDARGYERFRDLFEAIVAYNE
ncbi:MAG: type III-A CRISPR-associated protein Csm2 [Bryobacteraceae bacterium]|nr:type III-A CRISPR-associated protein Csm2 [Bryobacteraceae bacterium]